MLFPFRWFFHHSFGLVFAYWIFHFCSFWLGRRCIEMTNTNIWFSHFTCFCFFAITEMTTMSTRLWCIQIDKIQYHPQQSTRNPLSVHLFHFFYVCLISFVTGIHLLHKFPFFRIAVLFAVVLAQVCLLPSILGSFDPWHRHRHKHTKRKTWRRKGTDHANRHNFQGANYSIVWSLEFEHSMAFEFVSLKLKENA